MSGGGEVLVGRFGFVEAEHAIDHRLDVVCGNRRVHGLEHLRRADRNALKVCALGEYPAGVDLSRRAAQYPDDADLAAAANDVERWAKRSGAADIDHVIDPF